LLGLHIVLCFCAIISYYFGHRVHLHVYHISFVAHRLGYKHEPLNDELNSPDIVNRTLELKPVTDPMFKSPSGKQPLQFLMQNHPPEEKPLIENMLTRGKIILFIN
jgi:hypothetical protein